MTVCVATATRETDRDNLEARVGAGGGAAVAQLRCSPYKRAHYQGP